jgi:hypothetical protein
MGCDGNKGSEGVKGYDGDKVCDGGNGCRVGAEGSTGRRRKVYLLSSSLPLRISNLRRCLVAFLVRLQAVKQGMVGFRWWRRARPC